MDRWAKENEALEQRSKPLVDENGRFNRDICSRVALAAHLLFSHGSPIKTATYLNAGLAAGVQGVDRHHVSRLFKSEIARLRRLKLGKYTIEFTKADMLRVEALETVYQDARTRAEYRGLKGSELALSIHHTFDLARAVHRSAAKFNAAARESCAFDGRGIALPSLPVSSNPQPSEHRNEHERRPSIAQHKRRSFRRASG